MSVYSLFSEGQGSTKVPEVDVDVSTLNQIHDFDAFIEHHKNRKNILLDYKIDDILEFFDCLASSWESPSHPLQIYKNFGLSYLIQWLRHPNLCKLSDISINNNRKYLDELTENPIYQGIQFRAHPQGLICHWIAGNVPVLGIISLVQGILTKNLNLIRTSKSFGSIMPNILETFKEIEFRNDQGDLISGGKIAKTVSVIYYEKDETEIANVLSQNADVRVIWGGHEAVNAVKNLRKTIDCTDIIFGPKYSYAIIDNTFLSDERSATEASQRLAFDIATNDQRGCNSPHTLFIEKGGKISTERFCELMGKSLRSVTKLIPKTELDTVTATEILNKRAEYGFTGKTVCSEGMEWSVLFSRAKSGLANPCYGSTIFIREIEDIFDIEPLVNTAHQSVGLAISDVSNKSKLVEELTRRGVSRCPDIGKMSLFEVPWDGIFPMGKMVRWSYYHK